MTTEKDILEAKIVGLENEIRNMRMTLRDQFAMAALTGLISDGHSFTSKGWEDGISATAYYVADAMLEARK